LGLVRRHQLFGLVNGALSDLPQAAGLPEPILENLAELAKRSRLQALLRLGEVQHIADVFQRAGIAVLQLKGAPLSERLYGDALLRHSMDIDLLVPPALLEEAVAALRRLGYATDEQVPSKRGLHDRLQRRAYHHCMLRNHLDVSVELHWRMGTYSETHTNRLIARSVASPVGISVLPAAAELAYLVAHGTCHYWSRLKWLSDIKQALLCSASRAWPEFLAECAEVGVQHAVEVTRCVLSMIYTTSSMQLPRSDIEPQARHWRSARYALYRMHAPAVIEHDMRSALDRTRYRLDCATLDDKFAVLLRCADRVRKLAYHS
jgi:hypothetical protein